MTKHLLALLSCAAILASVLSPAFTYASTFRPLGFSTLAQDAQDIVIGTVVEQEVLETGQVLPRKEQKRDSIAPLGRQHEAEFADFVADMRDLDGKPSFDAPERIDAVEGGLMLYTKVTLKVEQRIGTKGDSTISFVLAGGDDGETIVTVHGMPTFTTGARYNGFPASRLSGTPLTPSWE